MLELFEAGGWLMWPILACSIIATAITLERSWVLRRQRIMPSSLIHHISQLSQRGLLDTNEIQEIGRSSPLGRILASALVNRHHSREVMKDSIDETGRQVVLELERYLNTLGTIAAIAPLLGLLGTVFGMIEVFSVIVVHGNGEPGVLAGGIAKALITTAAGLMVAIPALFFHRYFEGKVDHLVIGMEGEALRAVEILQGERERDVQP